MKGVDNALNLILAESIERVFDLHGVTTIEMGVYLIRGDCVMTIGEIDEVTDKAINWKDVKVKGIPSI